VARRYFREVVVNVGRSVGTCLNDLAHYIDRDSTYGTLAHYLYGHGGGRVIEDLDEANSALRANGLKVTFLTTSRNPKNLNWRENGVRVVVDSTGQFRDPTLPAEYSKGSLRGHLESGAEKVIVSAPFKIKDKTVSIPEDAVTTVMGINEDAYDARAHHLISNASCTTTCLAHMVKPLLDYFGSKRILTASMATVHAVTGSQEVLDRLPKSGATDLRKNRSVLNNIILTTTGAADTLSLVIPEMKQIGFIAESVRIPNSTGSLIILVVNLQEEPGAESIRRELINRIYREREAEDPRGYLQFSEKQNVSSDIIAHQKAATIIEGHETHTRTAEVGIDLSMICSGPGEEIPQTGLGNSVRIAITQAVIYGWYDNELGSYVNLLGDSTVSIAEIL
jgi:glyceraldehyde 3-phosphate dehydrogenase